MASKTKTQAATPVQAGSKRERRTLRVDDWMTRVVHSVKPKENILHARALLEKERINQLPVVVNGKLVGIVTDRDLRDAFPSVFDSARKPSDDPEKISVDQVMTRDVLTLAPDDSVIDAARLMRKERVGAAPVVEGATIVGLVTRSDLLDALIAIAGGELLPDGI